MLSLTTTLREKLNYRNNRLIKLYINRSRVALLYIIIDFRLSTSQLCVDHVKYLIRVSIALTERRNTIEVIMLDNMISRLYGLLTEDAKSTLLDDLTNLYANCNSPILYWLIATMKGSRRKHSMHKFDDLPRAFLDLREHPTTRNWKRLVRRLNINFKFQININFNIISKKFRTKFFLHDRCSIYLRCKQ